VGENHEIVHFKMLSCTKFCQNEKEIKGRKIEIAAVQIGRAIKGQKFHW
jgi:hypothetical protein